MEKLPPRLAIVFALVCAWFAGGYVNNTMTNSIGSLTIALVDDRSLVVDRYAPYDLDISTRGGHLYSGMPPGLSFLLVPAYATLKAPLALVPASRIAAIDEIFRADTAQRIPGARASEKRATLALLLVWGVLVLAIPLALLLAARFARLAARVHPAHAAAIPVTTAFLLLGTPLTDFTATLLHTTTAAALLWLGFSGLYAEGERVGEASAARWIGWGAALGAVSTMDYPAIAYALIAGAAGWLALPGPMRVRARAAAWLALGFALPLVACGIYHAVAFGSPLTTAYQMRVIDLSPFFAATAGLSGLPKLLATLPDGPRLWRAFTDADISVWIYNPALPLGIVAAVARLVRDRADPRRRALWLGVLGVMLTNFTYFASLPLTLNPAGGSYGARYTVYSVPFSLLALLPELDRLRRRAGSAVLVAALGLAAIPAWLYLLYGSPRQSFEQYAASLAHCGPAGYTLYKACLTGRVGSVAGWTGFVSLLLVCGAVALAPRSRVVNRA